MSIFERAKLKFDEVVGHVEEVVGGAVGNKAMEFDGDAKENLAEVREEELERGTGSVQNDPDDPDDGVTAKV